MARANQEFFVKFRKEINEDNTPPTTLELLDCGFLCPPGLEPENSLAYANLVNLQKYERVLKSISDESPQQFLEKLESLYDECKKKDAYISLLEKQLEDTQANFTDTEAYDEMCQQNIELSNEVKALRKANLELQNKLDAAIETSGGETENIVSYEAFIRFINTSYDEEEVKAVRNLGRLFFDGKTKMSINEAAENKLASFKIPHNVNNYNAPVSQVAQNIQNNKLIDHDK